MFVIKNKETGEVLAFCSEIKDAKAIKESSSKVDKIKIIIEEVKVKNERQGD